MIKSFEEFKRELEKNKTKPIEEILSTSKDIVREIPNLQEKIDGMIKCRGTIIQFSTDLEAIFNEIIMLTNHPERVNVKSFEKKAGFIMQVLKEIDKEEKFIDKKDFIKKIKRIIRIRHLYGHLPQNYLSDGISFETREFYSSWEKDIKGKTIRELNREFDGLYRDILAKNEILLVLLKKHLDGLNNKNP